MPLACTIVANNYLAYARVLAHSFREQHPDGTFHVLVVDRRHPSVDYSKEPFVTWFVEDLGIPRFPFLAFGYSILELSTAVKPWFLRHLHRQTGCRSILYFDPDILVLSPLDELFGRLERADALLTPHITRPLEDAATPGERDFLLSGIYNLGFAGFAFNDRTLAYLDWWHRRLERECLHAVERGLFVDQRWMDFAPAFLAGTEILHEPRWNVAYWNLAHRKLSQDRDGRWQVEGQPLGFYHFSGYAIERPDQISKYQNRYTLSERGDLEPLFVSYRERLIAADHEALQKIPYAFGAFSDGSRVSDLARRMLRQLDGHGVRWPDPFDAKQRGSFAEWLRSPDRPDEKPFLPRLAVGLWGERPDLRQVFPALEGASREGFARWLVASSIGELGTELVARIEDSLRPRAGTQDAGLELMQRRVWHWLAQEGFIAHESLSDDEIASLVAEAEPFPGTTPLFPRLGRILHRMRRDLQLSYPDPSGRDRLGFALWFATSARLEYALPWRLVGPVVRSLPPRQAAWATAWWARAWWRRRPARRAIRKALEAQVDAAATAAQEREPATEEPGCPGVNVIGWTTAPTGVGEACRGSIAALRASGVPHAVWQLGTQAPGERPSGDDGAPYDLDLLHVNADMMETVSRELPPLVTLGRHRVGYWFWELSHFPLALTSAFDYVDEVWAPSRFCFEAYSAVAPVPVRWLPPAVPERPAERLSREELGLPSNGFLFLCAFDARSVPERKNPAAAVAAFARAVAQCLVPMHLLVKVNHAEDASEVVEQLRAAARNLPVTLMTTTLSRERTDALIACCDAVVSLHRSEGLGLPFIEAMQVGRPVVATGYGGCSDFLDEGVAWVVRHRLVALDRNHGPYPRGAVWADPDVEHAAELMVEVVTDASARERKTAAARRRVRELYAPEVAGARFRRELERIFATRRGPVAADRLTAAVAQAVVAVASSAALSSLG